MSLLITFHIWSCSCDRHELNTTFKSHFSLKDTKLGYVGGVAIARALKENMTITNIK